MVRLPTSREVLAIEEAHRAAQARLGIAGAFLALRDWKSVSATAPTTSSDAWLSRSLVMIRAIQRKSGRLAKAYYQLARAIETGYTLGIPEYSPDPKTVTMGGLRQQLLDLLLEVADLDKPQEPTAGETPAADSDEKWLADELQQANGEIAGRDEGRQIVLTDTDLDSYIQDWLDEVAPDTDDTPIHVDEFEWPEVTGDSVEEIFADELKAAADEREKYLNKIRKDEELTAKQALDKVQAVHDATGSVLAGKVDMAGISAGRDLINFVQPKDIRVMMVARGTSGRPCAFCAMLASRGFTYRNKSTATTTNQSGTRKNSTSYKRSDDASIKSYHPNCHCYPIVRWVDIPDPTAPGRSQHYADLWDSKIKNGKIEVRGTKNDTLNQWRRLINEERRADRDAQRKAYLAESNAKAKARSTA